jgi:hypothetical protein
VSGLLQWTVRSTAELEMAFSAYERVLDVADAAPRELDAADGARSADPTIAGAHATGWPSLGAIAIEGATLRCAPSWCSGALPARRSCLHPFLLCSPFSVCLCSGGVPKNAPGTLPMRSPRSATCTR